MLFWLVLLCSMAAWAQTEKRIYTRDELKSRSGRQQDECKARKELAAKLDSAMFVRAVDALEKLDFVLEANQLQFKRGYTAFVNATTNFISLHDAHATVQVAPFNGGGPNGVGGITLDGKASNIKMETDKRGNVFFTMNVMGTGISARVTISLTKGSNKASATIYPNFHSNNITLLGELMPAEDSSVFKGQSF